MRSKPVVILGLHELTTHFHDHKFFVSVLLALSVYRPIRRTLRRQEDNAKSLIGMEMVVRAVAFSCLLKDRYFLKRFLVLGFLVRHFPGSRSII